ncbi:MAG: thioredoxin family protein [Flavobacteriaceae bacterium]|nr:thioredoxin family protein [Flavobacteriaceae bacterium]
MFTPLQYKHYLLLILPVLMVFTSCKKKFNDTDYSAYFQGEVQNPTAPYVLFCKDGEVLDTIPLDKSNHFKHKFDSLKPGMYTFRINPEFQYVYFDKNDSITIRLNSKDFDHSIIYSGRGAEKNNFLMNLTVRNLVDDNSRYETYDLPVPAFVRKLDSTQAARTTYYLKSKAVIGWDDSFDLYAKTKLDLHFFSQKEVYPIAHYIRTGEDIRPQLPADYYNFRKKIDYNNEKLISYSSFTKYLAIMLNSTVSESELDFDSKSKFDKNVEKLNIVDTLISNKKVKNTILDNIAFVYLLEDQNLTNNDKFLDRYFQLSTDSAQHKEIRAIQNTVQNLKYENRLPEVPLVNTEDKSVKISNLIKAPTLMFVWTKNSIGHAGGAHYRAIELLESNPNIQVISVCIDGDQDEWLKFIADFKHKNLIHVRSSDFNQMKDKWIITKIQRSMVLDAKGNIINPFVNIFDRNIENIINNKEQSH